LILLESKDDPIRKQSSYCEVQPPTEIAKEERNFICGRNMLSYFWAFSVVGLGSTCWGLFRGRNSQSVCMAFSVVAIGSTIFLAFQW